MHRIWSQFAIFNSAITSTLKVFLWAGSDQFCRAALTKCLPKVVNALKAFEKQSKIRKHKEVKDDEENEDHFFDYVNNMLDDEKAEFLR